MRAVWLTAVLLFAGFSLACGFGGKGTESGSAANEKKVFTREEFKKLVIGKSPDEVTAAVGKPIKTSESGSGAYWYYDAVTTDPVTGKTDGTIQVIIENGRVQRVTF